MGVLNEKRCKNDNKNIQTHLPVFAKYKTLLTKNKHLKFNA